MIILENKKEIEINKLPDEILTMAEVLKNKGYKTYAISDNPNIYEQGGFAQGFDNFKCYYYKTAEAVNNVLKEWKETIKTQDPYFLYIHYMEPHPPFHKREPWYEKNDDKLLDTISAYDSEINYVDEKIQEMFRLFGWDTNTLLIITSDHGMELKDHGSKGYGATLYSEVVRVPLLIYFPEGGLKNRRVAEDVTTMDILPTLQEFVALPLNRDTEGTSLKPLLMDEKSRLEKRYLFAHLHREKEEFGRNILKRSVIYENWKYIITTSPASEEIYNLESDPTEKVNRIDEAVTIAESLRNELAAFEKSCKKFSQMRVDFPLDEEMTKKLKSLGYLQ